MINLCRIKKNISIKSSAFDKKYRLVEMRLLPNTLYKTGTQPILVPRGFHVQKAVSLGDPDGTHLIRFYGSLLSRRSNTFYYPAV